LHEGANTRGRKLKGNHFPLEINTNKIQNSLCVVRGEIKRETSRSGGKAIEWMNQKKMRRNFGKRSHIEGHVDHEMTQTKKNWKVVTKRVFSKGKKGREKSDQVGSHPKEKMEGGEKKKVDFIGNQSQKK